MTHEEFIEAEMDEVQREYESGVINREEFLEEMKALEEELEEWRRWREGDPRE